MISRADAIDSSKLRREEANLRIPPGMWFVGGSSLDPVRRRLIADDDTKNQAILAVAAIQTASCDEPLVVDNSTFWALLSLVFPTQNFLNERRAAKSSGRIEWNGLVFKRKPKAKRNRRRIA